MSLTYRPEIDGLRTIAVCSVLAYHAKVSTSNGYLFSGGFLGVDIFFVISGFLITLIIIKEIDATGTLSLGHFYERRCRRILPALLLVIFASLPFSIAILLPTEFERYARSLVASIFFFSNHYWHGALGSYGAQSSLLEPLVHTWSLAVEEQFYILFPLVLLLVMRYLRRLLLPLLLAAFVLGLVGAEVMSIYRPALSFFWLPSRVWELLAGAILAYLTHVSPGLGRGTGMDRVLPALGLVLVLGSMLTLDLATWTHPGFASVPAILGVCLIIWFANDRDPVTWLLSTRPFVAIGLISYSLYLWHYPIFAFGRQLNFDSSLAEKVVWVVLSFAMAILSYRFAEQPFRQEGRVRLRTVLVSIIASTATVGAFAGVVVQQKGFPERFPSLAAIYGENEFDNEILRDMSWTVLNTLAGPEQIGTWNADRPSRHETTDLWFDKGADTTKLLIVGDSHSKDMFNALYLNRDLYPKSEFARFGMDLDPKQIEALLATPNFAAAETVIVTFRYSRQMLIDLPAFLARLKERGKRVAITTKAVEFNVIAGLTLFDWYLQKQPETFSREGLSRVAYQNRDADVAALNEKLTEIAKRAGVTLLEKEQIVCDHATKSCDLVTPSGRKAFYDYGHFTLDGAAYFGKRMKNMGWLRLP